MGASWASSCPGASSRRVELGAQPFDMVVEAVVGENLVQAPIEGMTRPLGQALRFYPKLTLARLRLPSHRHRGLSSENDDILPEKMPAFTPLSVRLPPQAASTATPLRWPTSGKASRTCAKAGLD